MTRKRCWSLLMLVLVQNDLSRAAEKDVGAFLKANCLQCHAGDVVGAPRLTQLDADAVAGDAEQLWTLVHDRVASGEMPPKSEPRPDPAAVQAFLKDLSARLIQADIERPRSTLRRLNRVEYEHTICDLFGIRADLKAMLPEDPAAYGFDTVAEALSMSTDQMEHYLQAAEEALKQVFGPDRPPPQLAMEIPFGQDQYLGRSINQLFQKTDDDSVIMFQDSWCPAIFWSGRAPAAGTYRVQIQAKTHQSRQPLVLDVSGGDVVAHLGTIHQVGYFNVPLGDDWTTITFEDFLDKNTCYQFKPYGLNAPVKGPDRFKGPGLMIGKISITGPLEEWPPRSRTALLDGVEPRHAGIDGVRKILQRLLPRALRRQVQPHELEPYLALAQAVLDEQRPFQEALSVSLKAVLCSPAFLMRESPSLARSAGESSAFSDEMLAARLSYLLWSSLPDEELLALAAVGELSRPETLRAQTERLLKDPKSQRFVEDFAGQWLGLRNIRFTEPDAKLYPEFDDMLRYSMIQETERYFREILDQNLSLLDFVDSDWAILNERLAGHYGITGVTGQEFRRVSLPAGSVRGGVMTQASWLKVTANGTTTSPVVRGVWVLENLLGRPSPPPPAGVRAIEPDIRGAATVPEQLAKHRKDESCAVCHRHIDPIGLALEEFDPVGGARRAYRTMGVGAQTPARFRGRHVSYRIGRVVNSRGEWPGGQKFNNIRDVKRIMREDPRQIARCLTEKILTYSLGRRLGFSDRAAVEQIVSRVEEQNFGFRSLIQEVVLSPIFNQEPQP